MKLANKVYTSVRIPQVIYPGQLWFDESVNKLKIHDGTGFQSLDYFDYDITVPQDIDISQLTTPTTLAPKQRCFLLFTGSTIDLSKIKFEGNGDELYSMSITVFDEATIYSIDINHGFGISRTFTTQYSAADMPKTTYLYNGDIAFRDHKYSKFERKEESKDKFTIVPTSSGLTSPLTSDMYVVYRGFSEKRSVHYQLHGNGNILIGSVEAFSNGNKWETIGTINISSDSQVSGIVVIYRLL